MMKPVFALVLGMLAALLSSDCGMPPAAPISASPPSGGTSLPFSGTWSGTGSDSQGAERMTWVLTQTDNTVTGTVATQAVDPTNGSCASCHKNKVGTLSGTISGTVLTLRMYFPIGGDVPTPICSVTMDATASNITTSNIASTYSGADTCEGPFADGVFTMDHLP